MKRRATRRIGRPGFLGILMAVATSLAACPRGSTLPSTRPVELHTAPGSAVANDSAANDPAAEAAAGFLPPAGLYEAPTQLDVPWDELVPPTGVPAIEQTPLVLAWPPGVDVEPPERRVLESESRACRREHYLPHDPRPLRTEALEYDADGRVVHERVDVDTDGTIDVETWRTFGREGTLTRVRQRIAPEPTCSGVLPAEVIETNHLYDAHGVWLGGEVRVDGEIEKGLVWRKTNYDARGRPLRWIEHQHGAVLRALALRWDEHDRLLERVDYLVAQPSAVERWSYVGPRERYHARWSEGVWSVEREQLDGQGRVVVVQRDVDGDRRVDARSEQSYDASGREVAGRLDADLDGVAETWAEASWDDAGRPLTHIHHALDGTVRQEWSYDDAGRLLRWTQRRDESWAEDYEMHTYDASGRELERSSQHHHAVRSVSDLSSYVTREHWRAERDVDGRLLREHLLAGELGPNERIEHVYACGKPYGLHPRRNPLDHPETAAECFEVSE